MSPVNQFDAEGLPLLCEGYSTRVVGRSPLTSELYYGAHTSNYVVVGGGTTESDYPRDRRGTTYRGSGG
jgi:uncharacterized membrane protein (UPF0182 family)